MRWDQIDLTRGEWRIPETKNGESQRVVLSSEAVQILTARGQHYGQSPWVFPSTGASGHLQDPKKGWQRLLQRAELQDVRIHDLRRTLGSWQAATGANGFVIGKSLGHKSMRATEIYARIDLDPVRHSVQTATKAMFEAGGLG
jgi:integrase